MRSNEVRKLRLGRIVIVTWLDANASSGWEKAAAKNQMVVEVRTVGYVMYVDDRQVIIAATISLEHNPKRRQTNQRMTIPLGWIESVEVLRA